MFSKMSNRKKDLYIEKYIENIFVNGKVQECEIMLKEIYIVSV